MSAAAQLRALLAGPDIVMMPACYDALSARLIAEAGFEATFMSGFAVSAARLGMPDTGLISFAEMRDQLQNICLAEPRLLVAADGDTGYGNAMNVQRTVRDYARTGAACVMIEDQVSPKKCGHTKGKAVIGRGEARMKIRAAVDAGREANILILARTDARAVHGFEDALERCHIFAEEGADIVFLEAPESEQEMTRFCAEIDRPTLANMVPGGTTPVLAPKRLGAMGYAIALYPLAVLSPAMYAAREALAALRGGGTRPPELTFEEMKALVGFPDYYEREVRYRADDTA
jgi:2-methylisocitrate lyase-like PEP mutase family enzyme